MKCISLRRRTALAIGALVLAGAPLVVFAQQRADPAAMQGIEGGEVRAFVRASQAVQKLRQNAEAPVSADIRRRMASAVEAEGLSVERYNTIARRVRSNEAVYERYQEAWTQVQTSNGG